MSVRLQAVLAAGFVGSLGIIVHAFNLKKQFYPATVYLVNNGLGMSAVYFQLIFAFYLVVKALFYLFFGALRSAEVEHLWENVWIAVTETCLAMTVFRDEFTLKFALLLGALFSLKCFHWILKDRIDFMEQAPTLGWRFHMRTLAVFGFLALCNSTMAFFSITTAMEAGATMHILFAFESVVLGVVLFDIVIKYIFHSIDVRGEEPWENKSLYILYLDVICDFLKLVLYVCFFVVIMQHYGLPLYIVRDLIMTFRSFSKRALDLIRSRRITINLNERFADATPEDLANADNTCIICREEMVAAKKLPCGHMFHIRCLRSWLEQQQTCPTCRTNLLQWEPAAAAAAAAAAPARPVPGPGAGADGVAGAGAGAGVGAGAGAGAGAGEAGAGVAGFGAGLGGIGGLGGAVHFPGAAGIPPPFAAFPHMPFAPHGAGGGAAGVAPGLATLPMLVPMQPHFVPFNFDQALAEDFADMAALGDEELVAMEGDEREQVFKRVMFLRRFRVQLDLMLARFGQYEAITRGTAPSSPSRAAPVGTSPAGSSAGVSGSGASGVGNLANSTGAGGPGPGAGAAAGGSHASTLPSVSASSAAGSGPATGSAAAAAASGKETADSTDSAAANGSAPPAPATTTTTTTATTTTASSLSSVSSVESGAFPSTPLSSPRAEDPESARLRNLRLRRFSSVPGSTSKNEDEQ